MGEVSYKGHRHPAEIIAHCVWLYHRFPLSFREVEGSCWSAACVIITVPPRESKSTTVAVGGTLWALSRNPDSKIILASYGDDLAREHSRRPRPGRRARRRARVRLSPDKTATGRWLVDGHNGGLLATGIMSGVTGYGCDVLVLDDVTKNAAEADSAAHRRRVLHEFRSTLLTRVHPGGSVVIIGTRWAEDDLIGTLLATDRGRPLGLPQRARRRRNGHSRCPWSCSRSGDDERAGPDTGAVRGHPAGGR